MVNARLATTADAAAIEGLLKLLGHARSRNSVEEEILLAHSSGGGVLVATEADELAGFLAFDVWRAFAEQTWVCRVSALSVHMADRGRGVGRVLMRDVELRAAAMGCTVIELSCGRRQERAAAHAFYVSLGYKDASGHHAAYRKTVASEASDTGPSGAEMDRPE